jgi:magnesium transporter
MLGLFANFRFLDSDPLLGVVVGLSICCSMLLAAAVGTFTPLALRKIDIDPAIATGPFVTTSIDILGVLLYFFIAGTLLQI